MNQLYTRLNLTQFNESEKVVGSKYTSYGEDSEDMYTSGNATGHTEGYGRVSPSGSTCPAVPIQNAEDADCDVDSKLIVIIALSVVTLLILFFFLYLVLCRKFRKWKRCRPISSQVTDVEAGVRGEGQGTGGERLQVLGHTAGGGAAAMHSQGGRDDSFRHTVAQGHSSRPQQPRALSEPSAARTSHPFQASAPIDSAAGPQAGRPKVSDPSPPEQPGLGHARYRRKEDRSGRSRRGPASWERGHGVGDDGSSPT